MIFSALRRILLYIIFYFKLKISLLAHRFENRNLSAEDKLLLKNSLRNHVHVSANFINPIQRQNWYGKVFVPHIEVLDLEIISSLKLSLNFGKIRPRIFLKFSWHFLKISSEFPNIREFPQNFRILISSNYLIFRTFAFKISPKFSNTRFLKLFSKCRKNFLQFLSKIVRFKIFRIFTFKISTKFPNPYFLKIISRIYRKPTLKFSENYPFYNLSYIYIKLPWLPIASICSFCHTLTSYFTRTISP